MAPRTDREFGATTGNSSVRSVSSKFQLKAPYIHYYSIEMRAFIHDDQDDSL